jgi:proline iminopeptidase
VTHYWRHAAWLGDHELVQGMSALDGIPAVLIHGRQDVGSPIDVPWALARRSQSSHLIVIEDSGHLPEAATTAAIIRATDRFARSGTCRPRRSAFHATEQCQRAAPVRPKRQHDAG